MWSILVLLLSFANAIKPNFIMCFAPAFALVLLTDLIMSKGKLLKQSIAFGSIVLPSLLVLVLQSIILYYSGGESGESGIAISFAFILKTYAQYPILAIIQSIVFPLTVFIYNFKNLRNEKEYGFILLIWLMGLLEYIFLQEIGPRATHGNFGWGFSFCNYILFISSLCLFYKNITNKDKNIGFLYIGLCIITLSLHIAFGIYYLYRLINGFAPWC